MSKLAVSLTSLSQGLFCQMLTGNEDFALVFNLSSCVVPPGIDGPVAIYVTNNSQPLLLNVVDRETNDVVAGPTVGYIDTVIQELSQLPLTGSATNETSVTTQTITPSQASAIISAAATASPAAPTDSSASDAAPSDGSATATASASAPSGSAASSGDNAASGSTDVVSSLGGPNEYEGPSADGSINVEGWGSIPVASAAASS